MKQSLDTNSLKDRLDILLVISDKEYIKRQFMDIFNEVYMKGKTDGMNEAFDSIRDIMDNFNS